MKTKMLITVLLAALLLVTVSCKPQATTTPTKPADDKKTVSINGFLIPNGVDGYNWPSGAEVTIRVLTAPGGGQLTSTTAVAEPNGHFYQDVGMAMSPGMAVEVTDGKTILTTTLVSLTVDDIDVDGDTVSGTSLGGASLSVNLGDLDTGKGKIVWVTADGGGHWMASFAGVYDITARTGVQVTEPDKNGNGTVVKLNISELTSANNTAGQ